MRRLSSPRRTASVSSRLRSKAGRRDITLPDILVDVLRDYRKAQLELRLRLGAGKLNDNDLLFADIDGAPLSPNSVSAAWSDLRQADRHARSDVSCA